MASQKLKNLYCCSAASIIRLEQAMHCTLQLWGRLTRITQGLVNPTCALPAVERDRALATQRLQQQLVPAGILAS
jgi:hypothetical protein